MNYTKREWKAKLYERDNCFRITSLPEDTFQTIQIAEVFGTHGEDLANAHLIAAAPEMYEVLKGLMKDIVAGKHTEVTDEAHYFIKQALAKAEGKGGKER